MEQLEFAKYIPLQREEIKINPFSPYKPFSDHLNLWPVDNPFKDNNTVIIEDRRLNSDKSDHKIDYKPTSKLESKSEVTDIKVPTPTISINPIISELAKSDPIIAENAEMLTRLAGTESTNNWKARNKDAYGAFLLMRFNINGDPESFLSNPEELIKLANKLMKYNKSLLTKEDLELAKKLGWNYKALLAGAWLGGVGGVRKVLHGTGNPKDADGASVLERMKNYNKYLTGGKIKPKLKSEVHQYANGDKLILSQSLRAYNFINPADGLFAAPYYFRLPLLSISNTTIPPRPEKDKATPVEEAYFKHYLNLGRDKVLVPETKSRIKWDKDNSSDHEYVGIPQSVSRRVLAIADTLNTGKIYRDYEKYKSRSSDLPSRDRIGKIYRFGKRLLESNNGELADESMSVKLINRPDHYLENATGLEILGNFGLKWDKNNKTIKVYDTYDFPSVVTGKLGIPERKRLLKIREDIIFDPKKGSYLLRDNMKNYNLPER